VLIGWKKSMRTRWWCNRCTRCSVGCKKKDANPFSRFRICCRLAETDATRTFEAKDLCSDIDGDAEHFIQAGVVSTATVGLTRITANWKLWWMCTHERTGKARARFSRPDSRAMPRQSNRRRRRAVRAKCELPQRKLRGALVAYESKPDAPQALLALARV